MNIAVVFGLIIINGGGLGGVKRYWFLANLLETQAHSLPSQHVIT